MLNDYQAQLICNFNSFNLSKIKSFLTFISTNYEHFRELL